MLFKVNVRCFKVDIRCFSFFLRRCKKILKIDEKFFSFFKVGARHFVFLRLSDVKFF